MNLLEKIKARIALSKVQVLEKDFNNALDRACLMQIAPHIIPKLNKIYALYANEVRQELNRDSMDVDKLIYGFNIFTRATVLGAQFYQKMGSLEAQRDIVDYYFNVFQGSNVRVIMENSAVEELKYDALLKTTILDIENRGDSEKIKTNLDIVQDYLFRQINNKKAPKSTIGLMALFQFVTNKELRAEEYLKMYYEYTGNRVDSIVRTELESNDYIESDLIKKYTNFVQNFVSSKSVNETVTIKN